MFFLLRLERHLERKAWVASFGRPKMTPQSLLASPTGLSPYLRFGCLSTRLFYHALSDLYKKVVKWSVMRTNLYQYFRLRNVTPRSLFTDSFSGENSSTVPQPEILTLIKWPGILYASRYCGDDHV